MPAYRDFSFTRLWALIANAVDRVAKQTAPAPGNVGVELPAAERAALKAGLAAAADKLEAQRQQTLATIDRRARIIVPLVAGLVFLGLLLGGGGVGFALFFGLLAAIASFALTMMRPAEAYRRALKARFASVTTAELTGFQHEVRPETDIDRVRGWQLFTNLSGARTEDRLKGTRDGRALSLSEMSILYTRNRKGAASDREIRLAVIEVETAGTAEAQILLIPKKALVTTRGGRTQLGRLTRRRTGDAAFDSAYKMLATNRAAAKLGPELRRAILDLATLAPSRPPWLVFLPNYLAVLFPLGLRDIAFHLPPYWVPLDQEAIITRLAADLAARDRLINAVLALPTL